MVAFFPVIAGSYPPMVYHTVSRGNTELHRYSLPRCCPEHHRLVGKPIWSGQQISPVGHRLVGDLMAKRTLNDRLLRSLKPAKPGQRYDNNGRDRSWCWHSGNRKGRQDLHPRCEVPRQQRKRLRNPTRRALGEYGELTLEQARFKARAWLALIAKGMDPREEEDRQRLAEQRKRANSFAAWPWISPGTSCQVNGRAGRSKPTSAAISFRRGVHVPSPRSRRTTCGPSSRP